MSIRPNQYFLSGRGISRVVLQTEITRYLGGDATCRPAYSEQHGEAGFIITAVRDFTAAQLQDIRAASENYEREQARASSHGRSQTYQGSTAQQELHHSGSRAQAAPPAGFYHDPYGRLIPLPGTGASYGGSQPYAPPGGENYTAHGRYPDESSNTPGYGGNIYRPEAPRDYSSGGYTPGYGSAQFSAASNPPPPQLPPGYYWDPRTGTAVPYRS